MECFESVTMISFWFYKNLKPGNSDKGNVTIVLRTFFRHNFFHSWYILRVKNKICAWLWQKSTVMALITLPPGFQNLDFRRVFLAFLVPWRLFRGTFWCFCGSLPWKPQILFAPPPGKISTNAHGRCWSLYNRVKFNKKLACNNMA